MNESARINVKNENPQEKMKEMKKDFEGDYSNELYGILGIFYDKFRNLRSFHERYNYEEKVTVEHELEARIVLAEAAVKEINEIITKMRKLL